MPPLSQLDFPEIANLVRTAYPLFLERNNDSNGQILTIRAISGNEAERLNLPPIPPYAFTGLTTALYIPVSTTPQAIAKCWPNGTKELYNLAPNPNTINIPITSESAPDEILVAVTGELFKYDLSLTLLSSIATPALSPTHNGASGSVTRGDTNLFFVTGVAGININVTRVGVLSGAITGQFAVPALSTPGESCAFAVNDNFCYIAVQGLVVGDPVTIQQYTHNLVFVQDTVVDLGLGATNSLRGMCVNNSSLVIGMEKAGNIPGPAITTYTVLNANSLNIAGQRDVAGGISSTVQAISR